jgi:hypothetical protein
VAEAARTSLTFIDPFHKSSAASFVDTAASNSNGPDVKFQADGVLPPDASCTPPAYAHSLMAAETSLKQLNVTQMQEFVGRCAYMMYYTIVVSATHSEWACALRRILKI